MIFDHPFFHFRPRKVLTRSIRLNYTWGLGGAAFVLICLLFVSGILLKFVYDPFPGQAYDSIVAFQSEILFGAFVRNIHYWSSNILVGVAFLHLLRVFFSGGFLPPRQLNWIFGLLLFWGCLISNFTGYLLPWDQLAYWAVTICMGMLEYIPFIGKGLQGIMMGGPEIGPSTVRIFYTLHTIVLPLFLTIIAGLHFWYIRKAGGIATPRSLSSFNSVPDEQSVADGSELLFKELVAALVVMAVILLAAALFDAPLGEKANPGLSPNPSKAPWYFDGIQEMILLFHPVVAVLVFPILIGCAALVLPYLHNDCDTSGIWFRSAKGRLLALISAITALIVTPIGVFCFDYFFSANSLDGGILSGLPLVPELICFSGIIGYYLLLKYRTSADRGEIIQALFILLLVAFIGLTVSGIWFRGAGMALTWPLSGVK